MSERQTTRRTGTPRWGWAFLLIIPAFLALDVPLYARRTPTFGGIPFFIWSQFVLVIIGAAITGFVFHMQHRGMPPDPTDDEVLP